MFARPLCAVAVCALLLQSTALAAESPVSVTTAQITDDKFIFELEVDEGVKDNELFTLLYSADGRLEAVSKNMISGVFDMTTEGIHTLKAFVFDGESFERIASTSAAALPDRGEDAQNKHLLFALDFNNGDFTPKKGRVEVNGAPELQTAPDGTTAAILNKKNTYLTLTDSKSLLAGKDEITVTFRKRTNMGPTWWFFAAPDTAPQTPGQEHYLGILDSGDTVTSERYHNTGFRTDSVVYPYNKGDWQDVTLVVGRERSTLYINGRAVSEKKYGFTLSEMLGDAPVAYIGRANWGEGEWANGMIDDFAIFDFAPDPELGNLSNLKENITLPVADEETDGYDLSWTSSDESVITSEGVVTVPKTGIRTAVLTATMRFGRHT